MRAWTQARIDSMFMTLAAVVVALALGHLAQGLAEAMRRHGWFDEWLRWLGAKAYAFVARRRRRDPDGDASCAIGPLA